MKLRFEWDGMKAAGSKCENVVAQVGCCSLSSHLDISGNSYSRPIEKSEFSVDLSAFRHSSFLSVVPVPLFV